MKTVRRIAYLGGLMTLWSVPLPHAEAAGNEPPPVMIASKEEGSVMEQDIIEALERFRTKPDDRRDAAGKIQSAIEPGLSREAVLDLLGKPDRKVMNYALFYSSVLSIRLDQGDRVASLVSDMMQEASQGPELDRSDPRVAAASAEFKSSPFSRQKPAVTLIPIIKEDMTMAELNALLGAPNAEIWEYDLDGSGPPMSVAFDPDGKVSGVTL